MSQMTTAAKQQILVQRPRKMFSFVCLFGFVSLCCGRHRREEFLKLATLYTTRQVAQPNYLKGSGILALLEVV